MWCPGKRFERKRPKAVARWHYTNTFYPRLAESYNLEQQYRKPFAQVWQEEKEHDVYGPLSERMGVRGQGRGALLVSDEEMEAASKSLPRICGKND